MRFSEQLRGTWDADTLVPISNFIDAGDRAAVRYIWRGADHGPEMDMELTIVLTMRKGTVIFQEFFWNRGEALETLGLSEQAMSSPRVNRSACFGSIMEATNRSRRQQNPADLTRN